MVEVMHWICLLFFLYSVTVYIQNTFEKSTVSALFNSFFFSALVIYILGLIGALRLSSIIFLLLGLTLWAKTRGKFHKRPDLVPLLALCIFSLIWIKAVPKDFEFVNWDEFVSWGANIKSITFDKAFYTNTGSNGLVGGGYKGYPPGQQVMQYLFTSNLGWSEQYVIWAQGLILGFLFIVVIESEFKKFSFKKYLFLIPGITLFYGLGYSFTSIYADGLLGVVGLGVYCLTNEIFRSEHKKSKYLLIAPYSIFVLLKPTAIIVGILVLVMSLIESELHFNQNLKINKKEKIQRVVLKTYYPISTMIVAYISWEIYVKSHHLEKLTFAFSNPESQLRSRFMDLAHVFFKRFTENIYQIKLPIFNKESNINLIQFCVTILIIQMCIAIYYIAKNKKYLALIAVVPTAIAASYLCFFFMFYLFFIDDFERQSGGSIRRYLGSFLFIVSSVTLIEATKILLSLKWSKRPFLFLLVVSQILLPSNQIKSDFTHAQSNLDLLKDRKLIESQARIANQFISKTASVYYLDQGDMGYHKNIFVYLMMPNPVNWWCWSVGNAVFKGDIWTCDKHVFESLPEGQLFVLAHNDGQIRVNTEDEISIGSSGRELEEGVYRIQKKTEDRMKISLLQTLKK
jgi:hypothetical protein